MESVSSATIDPEILPLRQRTWRAGALTYTFGGLIALFFWLLWGDFALNMKERSGPQTLQILLTQFHASDFVLALLVTSLPQAMGMIIAPIVSYKSDRYRSRWGRRIPFLAATTPLAVLSLVGLAYSPAIGRAIGRSDVMVVASLGVFWGIFELCSIICAYVVIPGLINDVVPRPVLGRFFGMFRAVSLGAGMIFNYCLFGKVAAHYVPVFLGIAALYAIAFCVMCLKVKEGVVEAPPSSVVDRNFSDAVATYFRESFGNTYYYWFFASFALANMAFSPINTFSVRYYKSLGMADDTYGKLSALQLGISFLQAYPIGWLCDRFHPLRMTIVSLALYAVLTFLAAIFVRTPVMFGVAHVICGSRAGFWLTATAPLGPALLPKSRFAQFLSANHICTAVGTLLIAMACGFVLDRMHNDYRLIYIWACALISASLLVTLMLYRRFMQRGGPMSYVAPE